MGMVFAHDVADDAGAFLIGLARLHPRFVHAEDDAALNGFEAIAHVGDGAGDDDGHGIVQEGRFDFVGDVAVGHARDDARNGGFVAEHGILALPAFFGSGAEEGSGLFGKLVVGGFLFRFFVFVSFLVFVVIHGDALLSDVEILGEFCVGDDEIAARLHVVAHQVGESLLRFGGIGDGDADHLPGLGVHCRLPKLLRVHLSQAFVALEGIAGLQPKLLLQHLELRVVISVIGRAFVIDFIQRRLGDVDVASVDEGAHKAVEEGQKQDADVVAVDIGIGHDDDLMIADLADVEGFADPRPDGGDHVADFGVGPDPLFARFFDVEDLPTEGKDSLGFAVAAVLRRASCGVPLDDVELADLRIFGRAIGEFAGEGGDVKGGLADFFPGCAGGIAGFAGHGDLLDDGFGFGRILIEPLAEPFADDGGDDLADLGVPELGLGLPFVLGVGVLDRDDAGEAFAAVFPEEVVFFFFQKLVFPGVVIDDAPHREVEALDVGAAFFGGDVIAEGIDAVLRVGIGPLKGRFGVDVLRGAPRHQDDPLTALAVDGVAVDDDFVLVDIGNVFADAAVVLEHLGGRNFAAGVGQADADAAVEEGHLTQVVADGFVVVNGGFGEDGGVGLEGDGGSVLIGIADTLQMLHGVAAVFEADEILSAVAADGDVHPSGKGVDHGCADAVEAAGNFVSAAIPEFAPGVEDGEDGFDARKPAFGDDVHWNAAAIVGDGDGVAFVDGHLNVVAIAGQSLVDRVIDDFPNKVVEPRRGGGGDVHARAFADGFQAFEDLDVGTGVMGIGLFEGLFVVHRLLDVGEALFFRLLRGSFFRFFFFCHASSSWWQYAKRRRRSTRHRLLSGLRSRRLGRTPSASGGGSSPEPGRARW